MTQKKKDITGSVSVVNIDDVKAQPSANVLQSLQGKASGVTIVNGGEPGAGRNQIRIRGVTTLNNNNPLFVVDGIPTVEALDNLNSNDIESIQVLKDASAASIYGSRSAGGVIIITTRKGKAGKLTVDGGFVNSIQSVNKTVSVLNAQQWGDIFWDATYNTIGIYPSLNLYGGVTTTPKIIENVPFSNGDNDQLYEFTPEGTNWADQVYRQANSKQYFMNITTGSEKGTVGVGLSYYDQEGLIKSTFYERFTGRVNSTLKVANWITVGENLSVSRSVQSQTGTQDTQNGIPYQVIRQHPALPVYDVDGNYAGGNTNIGGLAFPNSINPVAELSRQEGNTSDSWRIFGNAYLEADLLKPLGVISKTHNLKLKTNVGIDYSNYFNRNFAPSYEEGGFERPEAVFTNAYGDGTTLTWINTAEYDYKTEKHNLHVLGGMEVVSYKYRFLSAGRSEYILESSIEEFIQYFSKDSKNSYISIVISFTLVDTKSSVPVDSITLQKKVRVDEMSAKGGVRAFNKGLNELLQENNRWLNEVCK
jgi:TonB-dependent SusC/RagA subfamily outer membrane receptor